VRLLQYHIPYALNTGKSLYVRTNRGLLGWSAVALWVGRFDTLPATRNARKGETVLAKLTEDSESETLLSIDPVSLSFEDICV